MSGSRTSFLSAVVALLVAGAASAAIVPLGDNTKWGNGILGSTAAAANARVYEQLSDIQLLRIKSDNAVTGDTWNYQGWIANGNWNAWGGLTFQPNTPYEGSVWIYSHMDNALSGSGYFNINAGDITTTVSFGPEIYAAAPVNSEGWKVLSFSFTTSGNVSQIAGAPVEMTFWSGGAVTDVMFRKMDINVVPEPASVASMALAAVGLLARRRRS